MRNILFQYGNDARYNFSRSLEKNYFCSLIKLKNVLIHLD